MRKSIPILLVLLLVLVFSTNVFATGTETTPEATPEVEATEAPEVEAAEAPEVETPDVADADDVITSTFITETATYFAIPETDVQSVVTMGSEQGEVFFTCFFAKQSGKTTAEITAQKEGGKGWGEMVKEFNLSPGSHGREMGKFRSGR